MLVSNCGRMLHQHFAPHAPVFFLHHDAKHKHVSVLGVKRLGVVRVPACDGELIGSSLWRRLPNKKLTEYLRPCGRPSRVKAHSVELQKCLD